MRDNVEETNANARSPVDRDEHDMFHLLTTSVVDYAILALDCDGIVRTWNVGAQRIKGYAAAEIIGRHFSCFYSADDNASGKPHQLLKLAAENGRVEDEGWRVRQDGSQFWANVVITALREESGKLRGFLKITRDLTERVQYEQLLEKMADHDPLTGVKNRRGFLRDLDAHLAKATRYGASGAVLLLDLDNFKHVNDSQGHAAGDNVIIRVADALQLRLRESDVLARFGGDEFVVLLPVADENAAQCVARELIGVVQVEVDQVDAAIASRVSLSVGIAMLSDDPSLDSKAILSNADKAMYAAKALGGGNAVRYHPDLRSRQP